MTLAPLCSLVLAQAAPAQAPGILGSPIVMMVLMFVMMYFLIIRPQRQRQKEHERLISNVKVGDHVVMSGGEHGIITSTKERTVMVRLGDNVKVEYERSAIATVSKASPVMEASEA